MKTVLLVHDHQENPWERKQQIEASGYAVELSCRGDDCLARLEHGLPDLVLMDVLLEGEDGFKVCARIRERFTSEQLPIVLSSLVYVDSRYNDEATRVGAQEYLQRPLPVSSLVRSVHRWAHGKQTSFSLTKTADEPMVLDNDLSGIA